MSCMYIALYVCICVIANNIMLFFVKGTRGLSLFYLETKDAGGNYNNIELQVHCSLLYTIINHVLICVAIKGQIGNKTVTHS